VDTSTAVLVARVVVSLACVLALLWWVSRRAARSTGRGVLRSRTTTQLAVVGKAALGGRASVALVAVGDRRLLLGVSEHGVNLLTEVAPEPAEPAPSVTHRESLDPAELERLLDQPTATTADQGSSLSPLAPAARKPAVPAQRNPLEGSVLDASTWRRAVVAVQERTTRR
jgi:flagellar protein FliO/FliZ